MDFTADTRIADIAATNPATIKVFQQHHIDFCCGGRIPLSEACERHGLDADALLDQLRHVQQVPEEWSDWKRSSLAALIAHIQGRYHEPLRRELPRLEAMLAKVVERHGDRLPDVLGPLQLTFNRFKRELLEHMAKEDAVLFPAIVAAEEAVAQKRDPDESWGWIAKPIDALTMEHEFAGTVLAAMRALTGGYVPPPDACPTFRGLYHGLAELENDMHLHVHLENNVLFPRVARLAS
jgi:regulator of cell morphogenesis and NO signaling